MFFNFFNFEIKIILCLLKINYIVFYEVLDCDCVVFFLFRVFVGVF